MPSKTSAVVLCRNNAPYLAQCLESLLIQDFPFDEILVVDSSACGTTNGLSEKYQKEGIRWLRTDWSGPTNAKLSGLKETSGRFIVFIEASDWLAHDYHSKMRKALEECPSAGFAYSGVHLIKESAHAEAPAERPEMPPYEFFHFCFQPPACTAPLFRREIWASLPAEFSFQETESFLLALHQGWTAVRIPERLAYNRVLKTSRSTVHTPQSSGEPNRTDQNLALPCVYDLTVLLWLGQERQAAEAVLRSLETMTMPRHTQIIAVHPFNKPFNLKLSFHVREILVSKAPESSETQWTLKVFEQARPFVRGKEVLLVSGRVLLTAGTFSRLAQEKSAARAPIYSAHISGSLPESARAWRSSGKDPLRGVFPVPVTRKPKRVLAAGFDLTLLDAEIFRDPELFSLYEKSPFEPLEIAAGLYVRQKNIRWFARGMSFAVAHTNSPRHRINFQGLCEKPWPEMSRHIETNSWPPAALAGGNAWITPGRGRAFLSALAQLRQTGAGHDTLFSLRPEHRDPLYFWLPKTFWEIGLQAFKNGLSKISKKNFLNALCHFQLKQGALNQARQRQKKEREEPVEAILIYFGKEVAVQQSLFFADLLAQRASRIRVLYISPSCGWKQSFSQFLRSVCGGTVRWEWAPQFESLQLWEFPFLSASRHQKMQAQRILKAAGASSNVPLLITGDLTAEELRGWQSFLNPKNSRTVPKQSTRIPALSFPVLGCALGSALTSNLDLEYYQKLSNESVWPVVLAGIFSKEEQQKLEAAAMNFPNLFIIPFTSEELLIKQAVPLLSAAVYAWKSRPRQTSPFSKLPEDFAGPRMLLCPKQTSLQHSNGFSFKTPQEALRWLSLWQRLPGWNWEKFWQASHTETSAAEEEKTLPLPHPSGSIPRKLDASPALP